MSADLVLSDGHVGILHYTLKNSQGEVLDSTTGHGPRPYLHGADNMLPGIEAALAGKGEGDTLRGDLSPEAAFGVNDGKEPQRVRRKSLPKGRDWKEGMPFAMKNDGEEAAQFWITDVRGAWVWISKNHPLAGESVSYEIEVIRIRLAKPVEISHGHPHGIDGTQGHHH
jgi:FKBP-type peptidyl-prolyl cis-trans isomerase SlyD